MSQTLAYEIGAVFLLCALLIYGTMEGFVPKWFRLGNGTLVAIAAALLAWTLYHYGPEMIALWAPSAAQIEQPAHSTHAGSPPSPARAVRKPASQPAVPPDPPHWKTTVIDDAIPKPIAEEPPPQPAAPEIEDSCAKSPYESRTRRWLKSMGCTLHVVPRKPR